MPRKSDWPTIPPAFDVAKFAKDSDRRIAVARPAATEPPVMEAPVPEESEIRLVTRPEMGATVTDDAWGRTMATGLPVVVMAVDVLKRLPLDHRAGFLLSLMDGAIDLETLVEIAGMPRDVVLRVVRDLFESGVVDFRPSG
ncbi:MAG: hypothetical protein ABSE49_04430 [Polyangiaceae bacterium]|jgi:hypothetical protein